MRINKGKVPLEDEESIAFHQWLQKKGIPHTHIANEMGGSLPAMKARALKAKKMGTSKGFPDFLVFIPVIGVNKTVDAYQPVAIEMKRQRGSTTSSEQKEWLKIIEDSGIPAEVCKGAVDAAKTINKILETIGENYV